MRAIEPYRNWILSALGAILLAIVCSWASLGGWNWHLVVRFALWIGLAGGFLRLVWVGLQRCGIQFPRWLWGLLIAAAVLRLLLGAFWVVALPRWGYPNPVQQAGYVMADAYARDTAAWDLSQSGQPLWTAYRDYRSIDPYGSMLMFSAGMYRYLGGGYHYPLLLVVWMAAFSTLAVLAGWMLANQLAGVSAAKWAAWGIALYPEAMLLGSTQMREAITIPLAGWAAISAVNFLISRRRAHLWGAALALGIMTWFTPPMALVTTMLLAGVLLWNASWKFSWRQIGVFVIGGILFLAALALLSHLLKASQMAENPFKGLLVWLRDMVRYQTYQTHSASGWLEKIFKQTPEWMNFPILTAYGVIQPFLPAALLADGAPVWRAIAVWRALGWTAILGLLLYTALASRLEGAKRRIMQGWWLVIGLGMLLTSIRAAADLWDNPRYRATWAVWQIALAAWGWAVYRREHDPWLRRAAFSLAAVLFWFLPWYLRRYVPGFGWWPVVDLFKTAGLGAFTAMLYILWDWVSCASTLEN